MHNLQAVFKLPDMDTQTIYIDPAKAQQLLDRQPKNRALRPFHIKNMAAAMQAGDFMMTAQGISLDEHGLLLDGQNRLSALIKAQVTVPFRVTFNVPRATFAYHDLGVRRDVADRTSAGRRTGELGSLLARLLHGNQPLPTQLASTMSLIRPTSDDLNDFCSSNGKIFSTAPVRLAVVTSLLMGEDADYVLSLYQSLVHLKLHSLPPVGHSAVSQVLRGEMNRNNKLELLARSMKLFRQASAHLTRLKVPDASIEVDAVRSFYRQQVVA